MAATGFDEYYDKTTAFLLNAWDNEAVRDVVDLAARAMKIPGYPMHYPTHHYLVPAVLLTAARRWQGHAREVVARDLKEALARARNVPAGSCGFQGACGAAVGVGIFWSIITDTAPVSTDNWGNANRATGQALLALAKYGGPRCCKRCSWLALKSVVPKANAKLKLGLEASNPVCGFHPNNNECQHDKCPFYPKEQASQR